MTKYPPAKETPSQRKTINKIKKDLSVVMEYVIFEKASSKTLRKIKLNLKNVLDPFLETKKISNYKIEIDRIINENTILGQVYLSFFKSKKEKSTFTLILDFSITPN